MGNKYIIELEDKPFHKENGDFLYRVKGFNSLVFDMTGIGMLTPYTEPDLEQVREEAYEDGYKTAKVQCNIQAEKDLREVGERHYQKGLSDAWEAARKICLEEDDGGIPASAINDIFNVRNYRYAVKDYSASECIEKIRQYEQEKKEIQVGDEVEFCNGEKSVVLVVEDGKPVKLLEADGYTTTADGDLLSSMKKTGRTFPEIAEVLEKMRGE